MEMQRGLKCETHKSVDDISWYQVVKHHAGDGEVQKDLTKLGGRLNFRIGKSQECMEKKTECQFAAKEDLGALIPIISHVLTDQREKSKGMRGWSAAS